ncbi:cyclic AMP-dependent transcription factor ATF-2 isoform X2 [Frankliniella occidentalis]|uniref:Cyclic AMP-dependent transcription factor ATF-2 isoform X2 n=1 Tax=Frankliniella occidentalis TaxID=133901 RepID=A0A9C6U3K9_FRAOC|nr:cyclic AMP-dependent transcription factor ATF-2 isoform X2 [Frankliniella occidentalis]
MNPTMADNEDNKSFLCGGSGGFSRKDQSSSYKNLDMILSFGSKSDSFLSDQTLTPQTRLLQKCEEVGLFQDLQNMNPFEETFRKAAEDIRSGTDPLEMSSLSVPNTADDSLHTPHVIFPLANECIKRKGGISPREDISIPLMQSDEPLCIPIDSVSAEKPILQQEADTSEEAQISDAHVSGCEDESEHGTIQFLLRMPNGKMVQLSSLPVEQMDTANQSSKEKDIPIIKVDSSFLKTVDNRTQSSFSKVCSASSSPASSSTNNRIETNAMENVEPSSSAKLKSNLRSPKEEHLSKMSLAKLKLKQALMNNSCPAANLSSSGISSTITSQIVPSFMENQTIESRRSSSPSEESGMSNEQGRDLSSVEEKRKRNRAAAMRCREKRKTWVKELERRANDMLRTNAQLQHEVSMLRDEVAQLKTLLLAHRDCPVTQALVQGKATLPIGSTVLNSATDSPIGSIKRSLNKDLKSPPSTIVYQTSSHANPVKPVILLNDPPVKRKRLNSSNVNASTAGSSATAVSVVTSTSSSVHTLVLPSSNSTVLNPSFVNVIPSVLVANPTATAGSVRGPTQVIYSQILPRLPTLTHKPAISNMTPKQAYILPKAKTGPVAGKTTSLKYAKSDGKVCITQLLSTNVIKVNPNVVERDTNDSDIEILDDK